jgi:hypothetical protein
MDMGEYSSLGTRSRALRAAASKLAPRGAQGRMASGLLGTLPATGFDQATNGLA